MKRFCPLVVCPLVFFDIQYTCRATRDATGFLGISCVVTLPALQKKLIYSSDLPGDLALKNGGESSWIFGGLRFPADKARNRRALNGMHLMARTRKAKNFKKLRKIPLARLWIFFSKQRKKLQKNPKNCKKLPAISCVYPLACAIIKFPQTKSPQKIREDSEQTRHKIRDKSSQNSGHFCSATFLSTCFQSPSPLPSFSSRKTTRRVSKWGFQTVVRVLSGDQIPLPPFNLNFALFFTSFRRNPKGWFPKGWFWRMFPRNENRNEGTFGCSPGTKNRNEGTFACSPGTKNQNEGTFAKTTLLRNRPFTSFYPKNLLRLFLGDNLQRLK